VLLLAFVSINESEIFNAIAGVKISYEDINEWNRRKRLSRAYLDSDKDPTLESDLLANAKVELLIM